MPLAVCATPIGNLGDVTLRVLDELREADLVLCEDTRRTRILLDRYEIVPRELSSHHRHNETRRVAEVVPRLLAGGRVALVSDAGLPGISDPGARLVAKALVASGLAGEQYRFLGWLPRRAGELDALWRELADWPHPAVAFESPQRIGASLARLAAADPDRPVAVCRELTKRYEEVSRGTAAELAGRFESPARGELTVVVGAAAAPVTARVDVDAATAIVAELCAAGASRRVAADAVARLTGLSRNTLYRASL